jgi:hypothetical protein
MLQDTLENGTITSNKHYQGTFSHVGPRLGVCYQYEKIKVLLNAYIIEGPDLTNLTAV